MNLANRLTARLLPQFILDLLKAAPRRGQGLNLWLYRVARVLHGYRSEAEIVCLLQAATAGEPIRAGEIERAVENSRLTAWVPGRPSPSRKLPRWPVVNLEQREAITSVGCDLVDIWERSPVRFDDSGPHTEEIISCLFSDDSLLCVGLSNSVFETREREKLRGRLAELQLIVPSPMTAFTGVTKEGRRSAHALSNTGPRRFLVVEFDQGSSDEHAAILLHLAGRAPLALVVHSGSKSLHGWFCCQGRSEECLYRFMRYAVQLGADPATWTRSQFVRMPDGRRENGNRQTVFFLNPSVVR